MKAAKKSYYSKQFENNKHDLKKSWTIIKEVINKRKIVTDLPSKFRYNNKVIEDNLSISNRFNEYFTNIGKTLAGKIPVSPQSHNDYLTGNYTSPFIMTSATEEEILKLIDNLKDSAPGWDQISPSA